MRLWPSENEIFFAMFHGNHAVITWIWSHRETRETYQASPPHCRPLGCPCRARGLQLRLSVGMFFDLQIHQDTASTCPVSGRLLANCPIEANIKLKVTKVASKDLPNICLKCWLSAFPCSKFPVRFRCGMLRRAMRLQRFQCPRVGSHHTLEMRWQPRSGSPCTRMIRWTYNCLISMIFGLVFLIWFLLVSFVERWINAKMLTTEATFGSWLSHLATQLYEVPL